MSRIVIVAGNASSLINFRGHLIESIKQAGHELHAFGPSPDAHVRKWLSERSVPFRELPLNRSGISPIADLGLFVRLFREFRATRPDVVLTYTIKPTVYGIPAAAFARVPHRHALITGLGRAFTGPLNTLSFRFLNIVARALYGVGLRFASTITFQNPDDRDVFKDLGFLRNQPTFIVNGSGVDLDHFAPTPLPESPSFLMLARLLLDKGVGEYIAAARIVKGKHPAAVFHLAGPIELGPAAYPLEKVKQAMDDNIIIYHSEVADVRPLISTAQIYVLPSYREGTPRSTLEAMAMGRPIITTDAPGCRETVRHGENGLLVPVATVDPLALAMIRMIKNPAETRKMGDVSRQIAEKKYDVHMVTTELMEIFSLA